MANLIDITYFYNHLLVAQKSDATVIETIDLLISELEPKILGDLLGYELYKAYKAGIAVLPTPDAKWTNLRDGVEYTNRQNRLTKYRGFKFVEGTAKKSFIANYVYWHYMEIGETDTTGTGEKKSDNVNAVNASPVAKQVKAWNEMVDMIYELIEYLLTNVDTYPEFQLHYGYIPRDIVKKQNVLGI